MNALATYLGEKMLSDVEIQKIFNDIEIFHKMYDFARLVDPKNKTNLKLATCSLAVEDNRCFDFWQRGEICENCISMRALSENKAFVKMEYTPNQIFLVTSVPVELSNRRIVIEFLKDVTESMTLENGNNGIESETRKLIDNLKKLSLKDPLTDIYNRRYMNERLPADITSAFISAQNMSVVMADIDSFKKVNDTYGHIAGDMVLKCFAQTLSECMKRKNDWVSRYGGEEFLICLPGSNLSQAAKITEEIRKAVEESVVMNGTSSIKVTASFGIASLEEIQEKDMNSLIEYADKKLYIAKQNGKNRVES